MKREKLRDLMLELVFKISAAELRDAKGLVDLLCSSVHLACAQWRSSLPLHGDRAEYGSSQQVSLHTGSSSHLGGLMRLGHFSSETECQGSCDTIWVA